MQQYVQQNVGLLLPPVAAQAHTAQKAAQGTSKAPKISTEMQRVIAQVRWLCNMAGQAALSQQLRAVLHVRRVPKEVTQLVQTAGVQVTAAHLVEAAQCRVEGLDSWVLPPFSSSLPPLVQAVFDSKVSDRAPCPAANTRTVPCLFIDISAWLLSASALHLARAFSGRNCLVCLVPQQSTRLWRVQNALRVCSRRAWWGTGPAVAVVASLLSMPVDTICALQLKLQVV